MNAPNLSQGTSGEFAAAKPSTLRTAQNAGTAFYEHHVQVSVYVFVHAVCLLIALWVLWTLVQQPVEWRHLAYAILLWTVLGYAVYKAICGVRYGCSLRIFRGFVELTALAPVQIHTVQDILFFREQHAHDPLRRRIVLHLKSGAQVKLPLVGDPNMLARCLNEDLGIPRDKPPYEQFRLPGQGGSS